jgi:DMSO/TMAO reductase YedYZ molybdopterin-dependent catalytic subunit
MSGGRLLTRRALIVRGAVAAGGALGAIGCNIDRPRSGLLGAMDGLNERVQRALFRSGKRAPTPAASADTPADAFPQYFISREIPIAPGGWALKVGGLVSRPLVLGLDDLERMTRTDVRVRHHCVEGWTAVASWHGVAVADIAARAGVHPGARCVELRSFDRGYWSSWDRESAEHAQTILAYGMNGRRLTPGHGAPLRLYAAVKLGYKMVKYLTEVNFMPDQTGGYWEDQGYEWFAGV